MKFPNQDIAARRLTGFDFWPVLAQYPGVTIVSATFQATVVRGIDPSPNDIFSGSPIVDGTRAYQMRSGGVAGVTYNILCYVILSDTQKIPAESELTLFEVGQPIPPISPCQQA